MRLAMPPPAAARPTASSSLPKASAREVHTICSTRPITPAMSNSPRLAAGIQICNNNSTTRARATSRDSIRPARLSLDSIARIQWRLLASLKK